jgi:hypothetical protein
MIKRRNTASRSIPDIQGRSANGSGVDSAFKTSRPAVSHQQEIILRQAKKKKTSWPVVLFLTALIVPWVIPFGPLRMSLYRFVLLVMVLPCLGMWFAGKAGRKRTADIALMLYWFWSALSFIVNNGVEATVSPSGIGFIETLGPYLLARCYIRDAEDFYNAVQLLFWIVVLLLPFAIIECVAGVNILREMFDVVFPTTPDLPMLRSGLTRVQSVFDQPILFGVVTGGIIGLVHLVLGYQKSFFQRALRTGIVAATAFLSLSSGPLAAVLSQVFLLSWNRLLAGVKFRWIILIGSSAFFVLAIELAAKRSALDIILSYLLFDADSYWFRRMIFEYGWASALNHPLFGVGMNDWERPGTMPLSIDNFWLIQAVRHGFPAAFLLLLNLFSILFALGFKKGLGNKLAEYRTGLLITMTAFFLVGWTVSFWDHAYVLYLFVLGSGVWILDVETKERAPRKVKYVRGVR